MDDDIRRISQQSNLAAITLAWGVDHPELWDAVSRNPNAALLALKEGCSDDCLIQIAAQHPWATAEALAARSDRADPELIAVAAEWSQAARRGLPNPKLIAAAARRPETAAKVLVVRRRSIAITTCGTDSDDAR